MQETLTQPFPHLSRKSLGFQELREIIEEETNLWNLDQTVPVSSLKALATGELEIPKFGPVTLTPWSQKQLSGILGVRWEKWFGKVSGQEAAQELNRRLSRTSGEWKIRTRRPRKGEPKDTGRILSAVVSPSYTPIADRRALISLENALIPEDLKNLRFERVEFTDRSTHLSAFSRNPVTVRIGGNDETYFSGFYLRNSQVGFTALSLHVYFLRLVCVNGLMVGEGKFELLYRTHRPIADDALTRLMDLAFREIGARWDEGLAFLQVSASQSVLHAKEEVKTLLSGIPGLARFEKKILEAYEQEQLGHNRFALIQAVTSVARELKVPDLRFELEKLAGKLLFAGTRKQTAPNHEILDLPPALTEPRPLALLPS